MTNKRKNIMENYFKKTRLIQTEWNDSEESQHNYFKAIEELKKNNIPFTIVHKRIATEYAKKLYFTYSIILDSILILTFILALLNAERILQLLGY